MSKAIKIGNVTVGGGNPVVVQSMLNVHSSDVEGNVAQAMQLEKAGCEIIRVAVPNTQAAALIPAIKTAVLMPVVADIHFDHTLALESIAAGADKIRINPGNIGGAGNVKAVVDACREKSIPIRVGVNSGSVEKDILEKHGGPTSEALVESAFRHVELIEKLGYGNIVISVKSSDIKTTINACRIIRARCDYPLHLGVTETGTYHMGVIKSAVGIGSLLCDGIGDTIRVSLTADPVHEIKAAWDILKAAGVRRKGVEIISCPTCGRTEVDIMSIAEAVEQATAHITKPIKVAVMGCVVNGPGEAREADVGIAAGRDSAVLFKRGEVVKKLSGDIARELIAEVETLSEE